MQPFLQDYDNNLRPDFGGKSWKWENKNQNKHRGLATVLNSGIVSDVSTKHFLKI